MGPAADPAADLPAWQPELCYLVLPEAELQAYDTSPLAPETLHPRLSPSRCVEAMFILLLALCALGLGLSFGLLSSLTLSAGASVSMTSATPAPSGFPTALPWLPYVEGTPCQVHQELSDSSYSQPACQSSDISASAVQDDNSLVCASPWAEFPPLPQGFFELHGIVKPSSLLTSRKMPEQPGKGMLQEHDTATRAEAHTPAASNGSLQDLVIASALPEAINSSSISSSIKQAGDVTGFQRMAPDVTGRSASSGDSSGMQENTGHPVAQPAGFSQPVPPPAAQVVS